MEDVLTISDDDEIPVLVISSDNDENERPAPSDERPAPSDERPALSQQALSRPRISVLEELMQDDNSFNSDSNDDELIIDETPQIRTPPLER